MDNMDIETQIKNMDFESMSIPLPTKVKCFFKTALPEKYRIDDTLREFDIDIDPKGFNEVLSVVFFPFTGFFSGIVRK